MFETAKEKIQMRKAKKFAKSVKPFILSDDQIKAQLQVMAQSQYMDGAFNAYQDIINILENLIETIPQAILLTNEGQANKALLLSLRDGVTVKRDQTKAANQKLDETKPAKSPIIVQG